MSEGCQPGVIFLSRTAGQKLAASGLRFRPNIVGTGEEYLTYRKI
jgi:hypothetical protein